MRRLHRPGRPCQSHTAPVAEPTVNCTHLRVLRSLPNEICPARIGREEGAKAVQLQQQSPQSLCQSHANHACHAVQGLEGAPVESHGCCLQAAEMKATLGGVHACSPRRPGKCSSTEPWVLPAQGKHEERHFMIHTHAQACMRAHEDLGSAPVQGRGRSMQADG
eukprot:1161279-Pelagomonas_calceolata.AAC.8